MSLARLRPIDPSSVLAQIVDRKLADLRLRAAPASHPPPSDRNFEAALRAAGLSLIAEIKRRSPSAGELRADFDPEAIARIYDRHASAISVVTDGHFFGGDLEMLRRARAATSRPVLLKDFVVSSSQIAEARAYGADSVLLMASILARESLEPMIAQARDFGMEPLVEVHDEDELESVLSTSARIVGINARDLRTLEIDRTRVPRLAAKVPKDRVRVAESGVLSASDVADLRGAVDAVLIGTAFMKAPDIEAAIRALGW